ncbi:hypothetical protein ruthe_01081 [Rubellimicrobium thermophilum DSM 16684]|uniref:Uncharacterized protein n=1 Tax=Rubellimicrobium thermophilum DSM 16684 TaxID=1123069 RepID=S9R2R8_9RHOB|nr:hypothetical protein [Rubellimicrobium thermophilum]EPX86268.1 hypothetical protein ruthe_01081 [Rubellimicrobium thermophilum DSM 16684]
MIERLQLHNPRSKAHIEDLKDRLLAVHGDGRGPREREAMADALARVVEAMDCGTISPDDARQFFLRARVPGFDFDRWLEEMVDEGVYVPLCLRVAA